MIARSKDEMVCIRLYWDRPAQQGHWTCWSCAAKGIEGIHWESALAENPHVFNEELYQKRGIINDNFRINAKDWRRKRAR